MNFVVVYGKSGTNGGAWMDRLVDMMDEIYTTVVLGDFNFVKEFRDRRGGVVLNG